MPKIKQKPGTPLPDVKQENAELLWHALFAITHAVEQLQLTVDVNTFRNLIEYRCVKSVSVVGYSQEKHHEHICAG